MTEVEEVTAKAKKRREELRSSGYFDAVHIPYDFLQVKYNGKIKCVLNKTLLDQQNCWENLEKIKEVHWLKFMIHDIMEKTVNKNELISLDQDLTECEFELQRLWGFKKDARFHRFWLTPKCLCPKMDNEDAYPTGFYTINLSCPIHGLG